MAMRIGYTLAWVPGRFNPADAASRVHVSSACFLNGCHPAVLDGQERETVCHQLPLLGVSTIVPLSDLTYPPPLPKQRQNPENKQQFPSFSCFSVLREKCS